MNPFLSDKKCQGPNVGYQYRSEIFYTNEEEEKTAEKVLNQINKKLGGKVIYFGKPYPDIYKFCIKKGETVLAIGDNIRTDIKGANNMNLDSLFITHGIHKKDFLNLPFYFFPFEIPIMSDSFIMLYSFPSIFTSVPDHLPKRTKSPTLTSIGTIFPSSVLAPDPTATTFPS